MLEAPAKHGSKSVEMEQAEVTAEWSMLKGSGAGRGDSRIRLSRLGSPLEAHAPLVGPLMPTDKMAS